MDSDRQAELLRRWSAVRGYPMRVRSPPRYSSLPRSAAPLVPENLRAPRYSLGVARRLLDHFSAATAKLEKSLGDPLNRPGLENVRRIYERFRVLEIAQSATYGETSLDESPSTNVSKVDEPKSAPDNPNHLIKDTTTKYRAGKRYLLSRHALNSRRDKRPSSEPVKFSHLAKDAVEDILSAISSDTPTTRILSRPYVRRYRRRTKFPYSQRRQQRGPGRLTRYSNAKGKRHSGVRLVCGAR